ncbi:MAG: hypothetical protein M1429_04085 [Patescibacteria group bacterium]|nr:hypothetical protein [Patescibacteria group bacterium]
MKNNRTIDIIKDIYYRLSVLPLMFSFWILIIIWRYRIEKNKNRLFENRQKLDRIWYLSGYLKGVKYRREQAKLKKIEKIFLRLEESAKKDEGRYEKQKELFDKYFSKVFDPSIGK